MELILRLLHGLSSRARIAWYRARGMHIPGHVSLRAIEVPRLPANITLEAGAALDRGVVLLMTGADSRLRIGRQVYINRHTMCDVSDVLEIGDHAMIGPFCYLTDHDHTFGAGVSPGAGPLVGAPTRIGAHCWLGASVIVLKGVTIGDGTVVGAGSVVTRSLPAGVVAAGQPARVLRQLREGPALALSQPA